MGGFLGQKHTSTHFYCIKHTFLLYHLIRHFQRQTQKDPKETPKYNRLAASGQEQNDGRWKDLGFCLGWWLKQNRAIKNKRCHQITGRGSTCLICSTPGCYWSGCVREIEGWKRMGFEPQLNTTLSLPEWDFLRGVTASVSHNHWREQDEQKETRTCFPA